MSKRLEGLQRWLIIINKLKESRTGVPTKELLDYVSRRMEERGFGAMNLRTLQRDFNDIESVFGIKITFDKKHYGYGIAAQDEHEWNRYEQLLLNFDLLNALAGDDTLASYVLPEHHRPLHSEWLTPLIAAIKRSHPVTFDYLLVRQDDKLEAKKVNPHFLKESNQRWYLLAYEGDTLKTFGIDRIRDLQRHPLPLPRLLRHLGPIGHPRGGHRTTLRCPGRQVSEVRPPAPFATGVGRHARRFPHRPAPAHHQ